MILNNLDKYQILLASNSPRRKELLSGIHVDFEVKTIPNIDESFPDNLPAEEIAIYISKTKANAYLTQMSKNDLIITADTIVYAENEVLGKPKDADEAKIMIKKLSGKTHQVITGVCLTTYQQQKQFASVTEVTFDHLTEEEIDFYVEKFKPFDKAGSYGIQEWIGYIGVKSIKGSYFNVMGLPIQQLYQELKKL